MTFLSNTVENAEFEEDTIIASRPAPGPTPTMHLAAKQTQAVDTLKKKLE